MSVTMRTFLMILLGVVWVLIICAWVHLVLVLRRTR